jgi:hypothetical protein
MAPSLFTLRPYQKMSFYSYEAAIRNVPVNEAIQFRSLKPCYITRQYLTTPSGDNTACGAN